MGRNERSPAGNVVCWMTSASLIPVLWLGCTWSNDCLASRLIDEEECLYLPPVQQSELAEARETDVLPVRARPQADTLCGANCISPRSTLCYIFYAHSVYFYSPMPVLRAVLVRPRSAGGPPDSLCPAAGTHVAARCLSGADAAGHSRHRGDSRRRVAAWSRAQRGGTWGFAQRGYVVFTVDYRNCRHRFPACLPTSRARCAGYVCMRTSMGGSRPDIRVWSVGRRSSFGISNVGSGGRV